MAWSAEITATVSQFAGNGCQKILLHLQDDFAFVLPSIYQVDHALSLAKRDREATNLLVCQLVRELCKIATEKDLLLVLTCEKNADAMASLLTYAEECVGLPRLCWSVREAREAYALLAFTARAHQKEIFAALPYPIVMTERELSDVLASWQMRYPIGRLCFVTARDLRQTPSVQTHIENMLQNVKTKS